MLDFCERVPEVGDFDVVGSVQKKILRLEIAVHDHKLVAVFDPGNYLLEKPSRFLL
jgi:hypothetical protein